MTQPNRLNYHIALELVAAGQWRVDHASGLVFGKQGKPFTRTNTLGYIQIKYRDPDDWRKSRAVLAHRIVWESYHGPLADGLQINHMDGCKAHNALANLEVVTHAENVRHAWITGLTTAMQGVRNGNAILSDGMVRDIYERAWSGEDQARIALDYGVTRNSVSNIKRGWAWAHITGHQRNTATA